MKTTLLATLAVAAALLTGCAAAPHTPEPQPEPQLSNEARVQRDCEITIAKYLRYDEQLNAAVAALEVGDFAASHTALDVYAGELRTGVLAHLEDGKVKSAFARLVDGYDRYAAFYAPLARMTPEEVAALDFLALNVELTQLRDDVVAAVERLDELCEPR